MDLDATLACINPAISALRAYHLAAEACEIKLNQNENPFDWPADVKEEAARFSAERPWNRYPDFVPEELKGAVARYAGVEPANVIVGNGSNEMLLVLLLALASPQRPLITCQPTFTVYRLLASAMGCDSPPVYLTADLRFDIDAVAAAARRNPGAVCLLCSPNNPTGSALDERQLRRILDTHSGFVICDQAYVEFGGFNAVALCPQYPNLIVTRTFSKAFAAAGLRLGYMIGAREVIAELHKIKLPYNINFFSEHVAVLLLSKRDEIERRVAYIKNQRVRMQEFLGSMPGLQSYESAANFILLRTGRKDALVGALRKDGILVRDVSAYPMLENCVRLSIGSQSENDRVCDSISRFFAADA